MRSRAPNITGSPHNQRFDPGRHAPIATIYKVVAPFTGLLSTLDILSLIATCIAHDVNPCAEHHSAPRQRDAPLHFSGILQDVDCIAWATGTDARTS